MHNEIEECDESENKEAIKIVRNYVSRLLSLGLGTRN